MNNKKVVMSSVALLVIAGISVVMVVSFKPSPVSAKTLPLIQCLSALGEEAYINEPIRPIPLSLPLDNNKVALGEKLFNEPKLSHDDTISCAYCHNLSLGGTDGKVHSLGSDGSAAEVNTPTVFNSGLNYRQFWNGRAATLEDQIEGPTHNPREMNSSWPEITGKLGKDPAYVSAFFKLYPDLGIHEYSIKDAIATFECSLTTPNSRFDKFLRGDANAINADEKQGYQLFKSYGCTSCHQGTNVGGNMYQTFGVMADYFSDRGNEVQADLGRFNITGDEKDRHKFRVPSLRLVVLTPPYFHDGTADTLDKAIDVMAKYQLGRTIPMADKQLIIKFLGTLPGEYKGVPLL